MKQSSNSSQAVKLQPSTVDGSLRRELTFTNGAAIVVANMIGAGIFGITGFLAGDLGRPSLVLGIWAAGAAGRFGGVSMLCRNGDQSAPLGR